MSEIWRDFEVFYFTNKTGDIKYVSTQIAHDGMWYQVLFAKTH